MTTSLAWEKRPGETAVAYRAFSVFRDQGPGRTLRETAAVLHGEEYRESTRRVPGRIKQWSSDHDWVERAQALDAHDWAIRNEAVEMHKLREADETAGRVRALHEQNLANEERAARIVKKLLEGAEKLIDELPLTRQVVVHEGEDGNPAIYQIEPATKNVILDIQRLHKIATRSEPAVLDLRTFDFSKATDEQLERIIAGEDPAKVLGESARDFFNEGEDYGDADD